MEGNHHNGHGQYNGEDDGHSDFHHAEDQGLGEFHLAEGDQPYDEFEQGDCPGYDEDSFPEGGMGQDGEDGGQDIAARLQELERQLDKLEKKYEATYWSDGK